MNESAYFKEQFYEMRVQTYFGRCFTDSISMMSDVQRLTTLRDFVLKQHEHCQVET